MWLWDLLSWFKSIFTFYNVRGFMHDYYAHSKNQNMCQCIIKCYIYVYINFWSIKYFLFDMWIYFYISNTFLGSLHDWWFIKLKFVSLIALQWTVKTRKKHNVSLKLENNCKNSCNQNGFYRNLKFTTILSFHYMWSLQNDNLNHYLLI